jgi:hypothetical protein
VTRLGDPTFEAALFRVSVGALVGAVVAVVAALVWGLL